MHVGGTVHVLFTHLLLSYVYIDVIVYFKILYFVERGCLLVSVFVVSVMWLSVVLPGKLATFITRLRDETDEHDMNY